MRKPSQRCQRPLSITDSIMNEEYNMSPKKDAGSIDVLAAKLDGFKESIDGHMHAVNEKLERLDSRLDSVDLTLVKQQIILEEHVKRTNLLEDKVETDKTNLDDKLKIFSTRETQMKLLTKVAMGIIIFSGGGVGAYKLIEFIFGG